MKGGLFFVGLTFHHRALLLVVGDENDFKLEPLCFCLLVELGELGGKLAAWRAPTERTWELGKEQQR
jgi:hypothetical protein